MYVYIYIYVCVCVPAQCVHLGRFLVTAHKDLCLCFTPAHSGRCGISPLMTGWGGNTRSSIYKQAEHADIRMQVEIEHVHAT